jgi:DNA-binding protein YbaB
MKMKATLVTLAAVPLFGFSSLSFAQDSQPTEQAAPAQEIMLTQAEMDGVTAGGLVEVETGNINVVRDVTVKDNLNKNDVNVGILQLANFQ